MPACHAHCHAAGCDASVVLPEALPATWSLDGPDPIDQLGRALFDAGWAFSSAARMLATALCPLHAPPWRIGVGRVSYGRS